MKIKDKKILISVVLPVYNAGLYLREAMLSIIGQSYQDWEMIVIDDGSTDNSWKVASELAKQDSRIKLFRNRSHYGVAHVSNLAIKKAKGQYLARMDGDDVSLSNRLSKQLSFLQKNIDVIAVGAQCTLIDSDGKKIGEKTFPLASQKIYDELMSHLPIQQPSMMINRGLLPKNFIWYHQDITSGEEHQLLFRLFQYGKVANLKETLLKYRLHGKNTSLQHPKKDFYHIFLARFFAITKWGYKPTFKGLFLTFAQFLVVTILPSKYLFPLFYWLRDFSKKTDSWKSLRMITISGPEINI